MSWITIIWAMIVSACLTLAGIHFMVWCRRRAAWDYLCFTLIAVSVAVYAGGELALMRAATPGQFALELRWLHVLVWVVILSMVGFVRLHLRAGRPWLGWATCATRTAAVLLNFLVGQNLNYREVTALRHVPFLGESVSVGVGVANPWMLVGHLSLLLFVIFTADAVITVWRRGERRQALFTGGSIAFFALVGLLQAVLVLWHMVDLPLTASFFFLGIVVAMGYDLGSETLRAAQLAEELRESEARLQLAADSAGMGLWNWDLKTNLFWATERARKLYEFSLDEPISFEKFLSKLHPDDLAWVTQAAQKSAQTGTNFDDDYRVVLRDGSLRWLKVQSKAILTPKGKPERITGVSVDITERKRMEEINRNAQELMAAVFNSVPGLLYLYTEDGRLIQWNRQHELMTGYSAEELLNFRARDWFDEANWDIAATTIAKVFNEGYAQTEAILNLKNGQQLPIFATGSRVLIDGKPHMVGIAIDISMLKKAEALLRESEARFRTVADTAPVLIWMAGPDKLCNFFNQGWLDFTGRTFEQEQGNGWAESVHPDDLAGCLKIYGAAFDARRPFTMEYRLRHHDGEYRWITDRGIPRFEADGTFLGYIGSGTDLTDLKRAEMEALRSRAEVAHLSRVAMLGEMSGSLAHELNQPLGAILSNAQAARRFLSAPDPNLQEIHNILNDIIKDDKRASEVIHRLRSLVQKKKSVEVEPVNLNELVRDAQRLLNSELIGRNVKLTRRLSPQLPQVCVGRVEIQQVLLNLMVNAMDAMQDQPPDRRLLNIETSAVEGAIRVTVRDSGPGIPENVLPDIFRPFFTTKQNGLGMGLAICRSIIENYGGRLWVENPAGGGALFRFELKLPPKVSGS